MRGKAMLLIMSRLNRMSVEIGSFTALEFFARKGNWHILSYSKKVKSITAWEIDFKFSNDLRANLPDSSIRIGDSFKLAREAQYANSFNFMVFDNPQGVFGDYCEHFECLNLVPILISNNGGVIIFNINRAPFNYDKESIWAKRRNKYYDLDDASILDAKFLLDFYKYKFSILGLDTEFSFEQKRNEEHLSYLVFKLAPVL